jgi:shikimate dehydrogenase
VSTVWLIGRPVAHSLSPAIHNAAFAALGLPHRYETHEVASAELPATFDRLRREDMLGANVTIPYKEGTLRLVDEASEEARRIGAVNTVARRGSRLFGDNTDRYGFRMALEESACVPSGNSVLVLGAGGAARSCVLEVMSDNEVLVASRTLERARTLVESMRTVRGGTVRAISWDEARRLRKVDLLVNATPLGLHGEDVLAGFGLRTLPLMVADLVPTAEETPLVRRARQAQHVRFMDGLLMLVHQAARSFTVWTGSEPPLGVMRAALPRRV